jgi:hypothetical protein
MQIEDFVDMFNRVYIVTGMTAAAIACFLVHSGILQISKCNRSLPCELKPGGTAQNGFLVTLFVDLEGHRSTVKGKNLKKRTRTW